MLDSWSARVPAMLDRLWRWRWWTSAALLAVMVAVGPDDRGFRAGAAACYVLLALLVWLPAGWRWARRLHEARGAYQEALRG